jgi:hypothetical protein
MARCSLTDRQKDLLRSIVPGLKAGIVESNWHFQIGDNGINGIIGLPRDLMRVWIDAKVDIADFRAFERCDLFEQIGETYYILFPQAIVDTVEDNFGVGKLYDSLRGSKEIIVSPVFSPPLSANREWPEVFVLMPFKKELTSIYSDHILKVTEALEITCGRANDFFSTEAIIDEIWSALFHSKLCVADCTGRNPNVFYELGIAHTVGKPCILITQSIDDIPFDLKHRRVIEYENTSLGMRDFEEKLTRTLQQVMTNMD